MKLRPPKRLSAPWIVRKRKSQESSVSTAESPTDSYSFNSQEGGSNHPSTLPSRSRSVGHIPPVTAVQNVGLLEQQRNKYKREIQELRSQLSTWEECYESVLLSYKHDVDRRAQRRYDEKDERRTTRVAGELKRQLDDANVEVESLKTTYDETRKELERTVVELRESIATHETTVKELQIQIGELTARNRTLEMSNDGDDDDDARLKRQIRELKDIVLKHELEEKELKKEIEMLSLRLEDYNRLDATFQTDYGDARCKKDAIIAELKQVITAQELEKHDLKKETEELKRELERSQASGIAILASKSRDESSSLSLKEELDKCQRRIDDLTKDYESKRRLHERTIDALTITITKQKSELNSLNKKLATFEQDSSTRSSTATLQSINDDLLRRISTQDETHRRSRIQCEMTLKQRDIDIANLENERDAYREEAESMREEVDVLRWRLNQLEKEDGGATVATKGMAAFKKWSWCI